MKIEKKTMKKNERKMRESDWRATHVSRTSVQIRPNAWRMTHFLPSHKMIQQKSSHSENDPTEV